MMIPLALAMTAADPAFDTHAEVHVLDSGLTVILEEDHRTDAVALHLRIGVGARDEGEFEQGCAHLFEHLMFEGSANVPDNAFDEWLSGAGGENNAFTTRDQTAYHMTFPSGALELALFLESDRLGFLGEGLTESSLVNQQSVVLQERAENYAEPHGRDIDALVRLQYPTGHPYHVPVIGTVADIEGFTLDAVTQFWQTHYRLDNAILVLVGNFDSDTTRARVEHWFSDIPGPNAPSQRITNPTPTPPGTRQGILEDDVDDFTLYLSWPTVPMGHPDEAALEYVSFILDGGRGTRLADLLYYKSDLTTEVIVYHWPSELGGQMVVSATLPRPRFSPIQRRVRNVLDSLVRQPPTPEEMERARRTIRSWSLAKMESPEDRADLLANCWFHTGDANCATTEWQRYVSVTADDVVRVVQTYLTSDDHLTHLRVVPRGHPMASQAPAVDLP